jgi:AGZA family xanthine/uracil permease-like MFS transporter
MLNRLFGLREHGTTAATEVRAGVVTFMTMCHIVFVQRALLGGEPPAGAGMDPGTVVLSVCLASALACFVMGLVANYPVALAPCMGENFFFVGVAGMTVGGDLVGWRVALTAVFISGALFLVLSTFRLRERIFDAIPEGLKYAIAVGIGIAITTGVGLCFGLVTYHGLTSARRPSPRSPSSWTSRAPCGRPCCP